MPSTYGMGTRSPDLPPALWHGKARRPGVAPDVLEPGLGVPCRYPASHERIVEVGELLGQRRGEGQRIVIAQRHRHWPARSGLAPGQRQEAERWVLLQRQVADEQVARGIGLDRQPQSNTNPS